MTLTFEVPLPPKELSPNGRTHFMVKAKRTREYRNTVAYAAIDARNRSNPKAWHLLDKARIDVTFVVPDKRRRDKTNMAASFKAGLDGIVDAAVVRDDNYDCIDDQYHIRYEKGVSKVVVEVSA